MVRHACLAWPEWRNVSPLEKRMKLPAAAATLREREMKGVATQKERGRGRVESPFSGEENP